MAITQQDILNWFSINPNATDKDIADAMNMTGVSAAQIAKATGVSEADVSTRYTAATGKRTYTTEAQTTADPAGSYYDVMQRSMLVGVPTAEYNRVRDAFAASQGIAPGDTAAATAALQSLGYDTGRPSDQAIVDYGPDIATQGYGNMSYAPGSEQGYYEEAMNNLGLLTKTPVNPNTNTSTSYSSASASGGPSAAQFSTDPLKLSNIKGVISGSTSETSYGDVGRGDVGQDYTGSRYKIRKKKTDGDPVLANKGLKVGDLYAGLNIGKGQGQGRGVGNNA